MVTVQVKPLRRLTCFEVDSGCKYTLITRSEFEELGLNTILHSSTDNLISYSNNPVKVFGLANVDVKYKNKCANNRELHVVQDGHASVLGRRSDKKFKT